MALIKLGVIASAISGKVSGNVFAKGRGGNYIRNWSKPTNPRTNTQSTVRSGMTGLSTLWGSLTDLQRQSWDEQARQRSVTNRLGEQKNLSGFGLFMKQNMFLKNTNRSPILTAPLPKAIAQFAKQTADWDLTAENPLTVSVQQVGVVTALDDPAQGIVVSMTEPFAPGRKGGEPKVIGTYFSGSPEVVVAGNDVTITIPYATVAAKVTPPKDGQKSETATKPIDTDDPWDTINENFQTMTIH